MPVKTMVGAINDGLREAMRKDNTVVVLGEDVGIDGGVFRVTQGLLDEFGPERVYDTPLSEAGIVGTSIGLAINGFKPVAEIQFMGFMYPGFDQIISHASRMRNRSRGRFTVPLVVRMPYGGGIRALEHHSESTEALFVHTPGLKCVIPSNPYDAKGLIISAIMDPDPVVFLEPKRVYRSVKNEVPDGYYEIPIGKANVVKEGSDITLISWGAMMQPTLEAAEDAKNDLDIDCEVIDVRTVSPLDIETIIESVKKTGKCIVVHEAPKTCGVGAEIIAQINEKALLHLEAPVERVTGFDTVFPLPRLENNYLPNSDRIIYSIKKILKFLE